MRRATKTDDGDTRIIPYAKLQSHLAGAEGKKPVTFLIIQMSIDVENHTEIPPLHRKWKMIFEKWWRQGRPVFDSIIDSFRPRPHLKFAAALCSSKVRTNMREVGAYFLLDFAHGPTRIDTLGDGIQRGKGAWEWPHAVALGYGEHSVQDHVGILLPQLDFVSDQSRPFFDIFGDKELKAEVIKIRNQEQAAQGC